MRNLFIKFINQNLLRSENITFKLVDLPLNEQISHLENLCNENGTNYIAEVECTIRKEYKDLNDSQKLSYISTNPDMLQKLLSNPNTLCCFKQRKMYDKCTMSEKINHLKLVGKINANETITRPIIGGDNFLSFLKFIRSLEAEDFNTLISVCKQNQD